VRLNRRVLATLIAAMLLLPSTRLRGQVTTATLYGVVRDSTSAAVPGALVTVANQGTGLSREIASDASGEFAVTALPSGRYTVKIQLQGFKTYTNDGLDLGAGQIVRQTFTIEVGQLEETITVSERTPVIETASAAQKESLLAVEVRGLPLARRNITSLLTLSTGATEAATGIAGGGNIRLNGVAEGGTAITVDGTDATANNETRGINSYGAQNQISVMSVEAVAEVQVVKGILPAEYGGSVGGQVNLLTRSGTNAFHGSLFENWQNDSLLARNAFLPAAQAKPEVRFNQFGGTLGGAILRNRAFFFTAFEGYRETAGATLNGTVPTGQLRDRILAALPMPETAIVLETIPLPNEPIDADIGRYRIARPRTRSDNTFLGRTDVVIYGGNLSVTASRMRPETVNPNIFIGQGNDQRFLNKQDRVAGQYVLAGSNWTSETRVGWNRSSLDRLNDFWLALDPRMTGEADLTDPARRIPMFTLAGGFATPTSEILALRGRSWSVEQKLSRIVSAHNLKAGFRWGREGGSKTNPQNPNYSFQTINDLLANRPNQVNLQSGQPPHDAHLDNFGGFLQDDWRVNKRLVLNLGVRLDFYPAFRVKATSSRPAEIVNLESPTDLRLMDFGAPRAPDDIYNPDWVNVGPRAGFAWTLDDAGATVIRGGSGVLFSPIMRALIQNNVADPLIGAATQYIRTELAARGLKWGNYADEIQAAVRRDREGRKAIFSLIDPDLRAPYTVQTMLNIQRSLGNAWMVEAGYIRTDGRNFPLSRPLSNAFDRQTGARPNPALGTPSGVYLTSEQTMVYNALQTSVRRRFANDLGLGFHYTYSRGYAEQGGSLASNFVNSDYFVTQDFFDPFVDRNPLSQEARSRIAADAIYQVPSFMSRKAWISRVLGGWQIAGIVFARTGVPLRITQTSGISNSRPDLIGDRPVLENYRDTLLYLDRSQFALVPTSPVTTATLRPGTANPGLIRGPGNWTVNLSLTKGFRVAEGVRLEARMDGFNVFNHVNYNNPNTNITSPDFGRLLSSTGERAAQIGARLSF
jgi:carboxypeptidase family protein/TonB-dependent receptor-like protein